MSSSPPGSRGSWLLLIPVVGGGGLIAATVGWWIAVQFGGEPRGGWARVDFAAACGVAAQGVILERLDAFGLPGRVVEPPLGIELQLPGMEDDLQHLPAVLAAGGAFTLTVDGQPVPARVRNVGVQLGLEGHPVTLLTLEEPLPERGVEARLDGAVVPIASINGGELQLEARDTTPQRALRLASDRAVLIRHPHPCPVTVVGARPIDG